MALALYDELGESFFIELVDAFYENVVADPILRPMYPEDLSESRRHLQLFLIQYWGGPTTYSDERGHPRLRMRHVPFTIDDEARTAWLRAMRAAMATLADSLSPEQARELDDYFVMAAKTLRNA
ncbi:MAG: globin [Acidobacteriota bacterium]|nr:globin [Acidobacteriota bacterium]